MPFKDKTVSFFIYVALDDNEIFISFVD